MRIITLIQARMKSSRLPGKVLKKVEFKNKEHESLLGYQIKRLNTGASILGVVTTLGSVDDPIKELCEKLGTYCYRGSENDVLDRFYQAVKDKNPDFIVRVTSDCPLIDSNLFI